MPLPLLIKVTYYTVFLDNLLDFHHLNFLYYCLLEYHILFDLHLNILLV